jgi:hypothetical protein
MFCPNCKAEYRDGFTRCSSCDRNLVSSLALVESSESPDKQSPSERPVVLWSGQDPVTFSVILSALTEAQIPYKEWQNRDLTASLSRPLALGYYGISHWEVRVRACDLQAASAAVQEAMRPVGFLTEKPNVPVEDDAVTGKHVAGVETDNFGDEGESSASGLPFSSDGDVLKSRLDAQIRTPVEVWSGQDVSQAQVFRGSLLENQISCWALTASLGAARLLVSPDDAARAREIIREILDRTSAA